MKKTKWKQLFLLLPLIVAFCLIEGQAQFKVGDTAEARPYGSPGDAWEEKYTFPVKILEVKAEEPRYKVRMLVSGGSYRDGWAYSWNVRKAQSKAVDQYTSAYLIGWWIVGPGTSENTVDTRENGDGTRTLTIERGLMTYDDLLVINADHSYVWKIGSRNTIRGRWTEHDDPEFPILLKNAHWGEDWKAGPGGVHRGKQLIRLKTVLERRNFWGPRAGAGGNSGASKSSTNEKIGNRGQTPRKPAPVNKNWPPKEPLPRTDNPVTPQKSEQVTRSWQIGDRVLAQSRDGKWYAGRIGEIDGNRYQVYYDDKNPYFFEWVTSEQLRRP